MNRKYSCGCESCYDPLIGAHVIQMTCSKHAEIEDVNTDDYIGEYDDSR